MTRHSGLHEPAVRVDEDAGTREEVTFFGDSPVMFGVSHLPIGDVIGGVILCPTVHAEMFRSYRKEVLLGRALAARGVAVQRFHHRGTGNSEGEAADLSMDVMIDDAREARQALYVRAGCERVAYAATRVGSHAAVAAAAGDPAVPIALWDPVPNMDGFVKEMFRSHRIASLKGQQAESFETTIKRLGSTGEVELLGYSFFDRFYQSIAGRRLVDSTPTGPVYVVPFGRGAHVIELADAWRAVGVDVTLPIGAQEAAWWLISTELTSEDGDEGTQQLVSDTTDWLVARLTG